jgi:hypothetical protein
MIDDKKTKIERWKDTQVHLCKFPLLEAMMLKCNWMFPLQVSRIHFSHTLTNLKPSLTMINFHTNLKFPPYPHFSRYVPRHYKIFNFFFWSSCPPPPKLGECGSFYYIWTQIAKPLASKVGFTSSSINILVSSIDFLHLPCVTRCKYTPRWMVILEWDWNLCTM